MPRYFFKVIAAGPEGTDSKGLILANRKAAWEEATRACSDMISDGHLKLGTSRRMEVWDEEGPVFVIRIDTHELFEGQ